MSQSRAFSSDPTTGIRRVFHYDEASDTSCIETIQTVTDLVADNRAEFNGVDERANWKGEMHRVASIPLTVYCELKRKGIISDPKAFKAWLNDSNNRYFRTRPGVL